MVIKDRDVALGVRDGSQVSQRPRSVPALASSFLGDLPGAYSLCSQCAVRRDEQPSQPLGEDNREQMNVAF